MKKEKSFYIGWQDEMTEEHKSSLKKFLIPIFIFLPILAFVIISSQTGFNNHNFELGKSTELIGIYHSEPVPILEVTQVDFTAGLSKDVLLVGYGKFGAEGIINNIEKNKGSLNGKKVKIQGTLIYGDNRTVLELTKKEKSLLEIFNDSAIVAHKNKAFKQVIKSGEILDPKCYFGVMKPGEGKIHKSCAIRCISGGIPPVLRVITENEKNDYYILLGENGQKINRKILDKIAEPVTISGRASSKNGWNYLYTKTQDIQITRK